MNNHNISPISAGWKDVKQNWQTPPGTNTDLIIKNIENPEEVAQEFLNKIDINNTPIRELAVNQIGDKAGQLFEVPLQKVSSFDKNAVAEIKPEVKRHIKGLLNATKGDEFKGAFDGQYFRLNYKETLGNDINIVFDFKDPKTDKNNGLKIKGFWVTNDKGESINLLSLAPKGDMYYHKFHWITWVIAPHVNFASASAAIGDKISLHDMIFADKGKERGVSNPTSIILHESIHTSRHLKGKMKEDYTYAYTRLGLTMTDITSALLAIGISPWYILPSVILNLYTYIESRNPESSIGRSYHNLLIEESNAFFLQGVLSDLLTRKGFPTTNPLGGMDNLPRNFNMNYQISYQPLAWGAIDALRGGLTMEKKDEKKKVKPTHEKYQSLPLVG